MNASSLVDELRVMPTDLMPIKGVVVFIHSEALPYRISERLHEAMRELAKVRGGTVSGLVAQLRDELHGISQTNAGKEK